MKVNANAKINLGLDVIGKREDGYHELNSLFCELQLHDVIQIEKTEEPGIFLTCSDETLSCGPDNLAYKAADILFQTYKPAGGVKIHVEKRIPMGAGLGGGSADAAAVLKAVNTLLELGADKNELRRMGKSLGADVPFFIEGKMAQAKGIGEELVHFEGVKLPPMVIIKPEVSIPTGPAYKMVDQCEQAFHPEIEKLIDAVKKNDYDKICKYAGNTFENAILGEYPVIKEIKELMVRLGAGTCVMTGSGSALFALFKENKAAEEAFDILKERFREYRVFLEPGGNNENS